MRQKKTPHLSITLKLAIDLHLPRKTRADFLADRTVTTAIEAEILRCEARLRKALKRCKRLRPIITSHKWSDPILESNRA